MILAVLFAMMLGAKGAMVATPYKYQVEWLEGLGDSYIETEVYPKGTMTFDCSCAITTPNFNAAIFGTRQSGTYKDSGKQCYLGCNGNGTGKFLLASYSTDISKSEFYQNWMTSYSPAVGVMYDLIGMTVKPNLVTFSHPMLLFSFYNVNVISDAGKCRIGKWRVYDNGILLVDMIAVEGHDGKGYMYDRISNKLYGNKGTGEFIIGPRK